MLRSRSRRMVAVLVALALATASAAADKSAPALDAGRVARIDQVVQRYIDSGAIPGAVTLVARHGEIAHVTVQGARDFETKTPMTRDTIFRIYSMSKPITSVAVLMLFEDGKLRLTDPVSKWIPELANRKVLRDPAGPLDAADPSPSEITVRDLLTHCSGLAYFFTAQGPLAKAYEETFGREATNVSMSSSEWVKRLSALPLAYAPGTRWNYSVSMDVLGVLVERVSGMPFADFLRTRLFEPLGHEGHGILRPRVEARPPRDELHPGREREATRLRRPGAEQLPQAAGFRLGGRRARVDARRLRDASL